MASKRGTFTTLAAGSSILSERYVNLLLGEAIGTEDEYIAYQGPAEITGLTRNLQTGGISASWIAADPSIDDEDGIEAAPPPVIPPSEVGNSDTPVITGVKLHFTGDAVQADLQVEAPERSDLTWYVRWKAVSDGEWGASEEYPDIDEGTPVKLRTGVVPSGVSLLFQVSYTRGDGRSSEWSEPFAVDTFDSGPPGQATDLSAVNSPVQVGNAVTSGMTVTWTNPDSPNFGYSRLYVSETDDFGDAVELAGESGGVGETREAEAPKAPGTYYVWVQAYSRSGSAALPTGPAMVVVQPV